MVTFLKIVVVIEKLCYNICVLNYTERRDLYV
jgi:hypothetical protein